jgi:hypothetical protein
LLKRPVRISRRIADGADGHNAKCAIEGFAGMPDDMPRRSIKRNKADTSDSAAESNWREMRAQISPAGNGHEANPCLLSFARQRMKFHQYRNPGLTLLSWKPKTLAANKRIIKRIYRSALGGVPKCIFGLPDEEFLR